MAKKTKPELTKRERQIMDIIYKHDRATAVEVLEHLPDRLSNSSVRTILRILVKKGHLKIKQDGPRYVYVPKINSEKAKHSALEHLLDTYFNDSAEHAVTALLEMSESQLSPEALDRIAGKIKKAKKEGR